MTTPLQSIVDSATTDVDMCKCIPPQMFVLLQSLATDEQRRAEALSAAEELHPVDLILSCGSCEIVETSTGRMQVRICRVGVLSLLNNRQIIEALYAAYDNAPSMEEEQAEIAADRVVEGDMPVAATQPIITAQIFT